MKTYELLAELSKKTKEEIEIVLVSLMLTDKIDFMSVNTAYVQSLQYIKDDMLNRLIEAETCVLESFIYDKMSKKKGCEDSIQRRLYLLNESKRFNMASMNEQFSYDVQRAKELSWYERNKR